jgi:hypothetical protein
MMDEEEIEIERKREREERNKDPEAEARKFRMFALLMFIAFLICVYFLFDFAAKQGGGGRFGLGANKLGGEL